MTSHPMLSERRCGALPKNAMAALLLCGGLAGCNSIGSSAPTVAAVPNVAVTAVELEGGWGLASYRNEADRPRTEAEAKGACGNPYVIGKGANGGEPKPRKSF